MTNNKEEKDILEVKDILEEVKDIEKRLKRNLLIKQIKKIKELAREIVLSKKKSELLLQEIGIKEEDIKRIIDFVNSLSEIQLSEGDIKELKEEIKEKIKTEKKESQEKMEKKIDEQPWSNCYNVSDDTIGVTTTNWQNTAGTSGYYLAMMSSTGNSLKVKI